MNNSIAGEVRVTTSDKNTFYRYLVGTDIRFDIWNFYYTGFGSRVL